MTTEYQPGSYKPLAAVPDEEDLALHSENCSPELITRRLRELVPLLDFIDCTVDELGPDRTTFSLPLLPTAMNQNGTHQAAVFYLVADYTLGAAMFAVLPGVYVTGIHDRCRALPVQFWLKRGSVHHLAPGTGRLRAEARIPPEQALQLRQQLTDKGRGELSGAVNIYQDGELVSVAQHTIGIYADVPRTSGVRANIFQVQNLKTSALMIAGLREDSLSQEIAQDQGKAIASRMTLAAPQLPSLVRARTLDVQRHLEEHADAYPQVLALAVGLDPKPVTFSSPAQRWFGVDLRDMLREREMLFGKAVAKAQNFVPVAGDLRLDGWWQALLEAGFRPNLPTCVVIEGLSMYLSSDDLAGLLRVLRRLVTSPESRLWFDHVTPALFRLDLIDVKSFLSSMARLGEPFISGIDDAGSLAEGVWTLEATTSAADVLGTRDPIHAEYRFSLLRPSSP